MPIVTANDIELYYESHGSGDPLVLIGGLGLTVADMRTLIVHGRADRIAPVALAKEMQGAIPGAQLALLAGGHFISLLPQRQRQFVATVLGFLPPSGPPAAA